MDDVGGLILTFFIIMAASLVQGAAAFGFALVSMPLLLLFMPTIEAVTLSLMLGPVLNIFMIGEERRQIELREVGSLVPGVALGSVIGMLFLRSFDGPLFKSFIAASFLLMALMMLLLGSWRAGPSPLLRHTVSTISGVLTGSTSMGGPPVVLYLTGRGMAKSALRGTLASFFLLGNTFALAAFLAGGLIAAPTALRALILMTAIVPGYFAGKQLTASLDSESFRKMVLVSMALIAFAEMIINIAF